MTVSGKYRCVSAKDTRIPRLLCIRPAASPFAIQSERHPNGLIEKEGAIRQVRSLIPPSIGDYGTRGNARSRQHLPSLWVLLFHPGFSLGFVIAGPGDGGACSLNSLFEWKVAVDG